MSRHQIYGVTLHDRWLVILTLSLLASSCATLPGMSNKMVRTVATRSDDSAGQKAEMFKTYADPPLSPLIKAHTGTASWYGPGFNGRKTASGEIFDQTKFTAAHRSFPLGSRARVTHVENGKSVEVEINDRGPYVDGRIIDLSRAAARALGIIQGGIATVRVELISEPPKFGEAEPQKLN